MASNTAQVGVGQVGYEQVGTGDASLAPPPPLDPSTIPWPPAVQYDLTQPRRRATLESFVRGPELPQPPVNPSTVPWMVARPDPLPPHPAARRTLEPFIGWQPLVQPTLDPSSVAWPLAIPA